MIISKDKFSIYTL